MHSWHTRGVPLARKSRFTVGSAAVNLIVRWEEELVCCGEECDTSTSRMNMTWTKNEDDEKNNYQVFTPFRVLYLFVHLSLC